MTDPRPASPYPIRVATADSLRRFLAPLPLAFGEEYTDVEFEAERPVLEPDRVIAAFDGDEPVGCAGALSRRLIVPGGEATAAAVTLVGTKPSHRRRGVMRSLMRHQIDDVRSRGEPVAILWASEGSIYQRFGYGPGTLVGRIEIERSHRGFLSPVEDPGRVRLVEPEAALAPFMAVHDAVRATRPGMIDRSETWWRSLGFADPPSWRDGAGPKTLALHETEGRADGYAIYRVKTDWEPRGAGHRLIVNELMATSPAVEAALWTWLLDHDLVGTIAAGRLPVPHPLQLLVADPRRLGLTVGDGLWLRLVDLPAALAARTYADEATLVLDVEDAFCPWNAGRWRFATGRAGDPGDRATAEVSATDEPADLRLSVADLAAAYLGAFHLADLARAGRVTELRSGAIAAADRCFAVTDPPWCPTMF